MRSPLPSAMSRSEAPACAANNNSGSTVGMLRRQSPIDSVGRRQRLVDHTAHRAIARQQSALLKAREHGLDPGPTIRRQSGPRGSSASTSSTLSVANSTCELVRGRRRPTLDQEVAAGQLRTVVWFAPSSARASWPRARHPLATESSVRMRPNCSRPALARRRTAW